MSVFAPVQDYNYIRSQNPYADIKLYNPGTKLTADDIALGGIKAEGGILDENLNGAQRYAGLDKGGTANEYYKYLSQQSKPAQQPQQSVQPGQDPMLSVIGNDPELMAYFNQAKQAAQLGSRNALEVLNTRGILNSSITGDTVTGLEQQSMTNVLPQLLAFQQQKQQAARQDAYNRLNTIGYADNEVARVLGIPVGTPSASYSLQEAGLTGMYKGSPTMDSQNLQFNQGIATQQLGMQKSQQEWENNFKQMGFDSDRSFQMAQLALQQQQASNQAGYQSGQLAIDQQNANTNAAKLNQDNSSIKLNDLIGRLNSLYTIKDPYTGEVTVNENAIDQLEAAILGQNLSDEDTRSLLAYYGLS